MGSVGDVDVDGSVCARVAYGLPWAREVDFLQGSSAALWGDIHAFLSCDRGHVLVDTVKYVLVGASGMGTCVGTHRFPMPPPLTNSVADLASPLLAP